MVYYLPFVFCYPCIKRASYIDNEAVPSLPFQQYSDDSNASNTTRITFVRWIFPTSFPRSWYFSNSYFSFPLTLPSSAVAISYSLLLVVTFKANSRATTQVSFCFRNWKPIDPGKFGRRRQCTPERRPPVHPLHVSRCQMSHLLLAQIDTTLLVK